MMDLTQFVLKYIEADEETKTKIDMILKEAIQDEEETGAKNERI